MCIFLLLFVLLSLFVFANQICLLLMLHWHCNFLIWSSNMKMFACNEIEPGLLYQQTLETIWSFIFILWIHTGSMVHACPKSLLAPFFFLEPILNWHSIAFFLSPDPTSAHLPIFRGMRCRLLAKMMSSFNFLDCSWPQRQHPHLWKFDYCWRDGRWPVAEGFGIKLQEVNSVTIFYFPYIFLTSY